jgi:phospholipid/cholesterol/gamma-HCH transport system substrate-binding protein
MSDGDAKRSHVRIAAAILAALLVAAVVFTYLAYTAAFTSTDTVTVTSPRAGLVMDRDAKVKYRGIQIGEVESIEYAGDQAKLTLAINSNELRFIPSNAVVRIASTTVSVPSRSSSCRPRSLRAAHCGQAPRCRRPLSSSRSTRSFRR